MNAQESSKAPRKRGLASADPQTRARVARAGGRAVSQNRKHMAEIGRRGGEAVSRDREHMAEIGRQGGEARGHKIVTFTPHPEIEAQPED